MLEILKFEDCCQIRLILKNCHHLKFVFFQILLYALIAFNFLIKKHPILYFWPPKQRIYDYFFDSASVALHIKLHMVKYVY